MGIDVGEDVDGSADRSADRGKTFEAGKSGHEFGGQGDEACVVTAPGVALGGVSANSANTAVAWSHSSTRVLEGSAQAARSTTLFASMNKEMVGLGTPTKAARAKNSQKSSALRGWVR